MIRIEDEEDVEAYKDAKAELDDEFKELEGDQDVPQDPEKTHINDDEAAATEVKEVGEDIKGQSKLDTKNASGVARDLKRNEMIDWQNNDQLNMATKMAIQAFEKEFSFDDFLREKEEKEGKKSIEQESGSDYDNVGEEEDVKVTGWDR